MKRKSEVSTVWNKLSEVSKTELSAEKVDLSVADGLNILAGAKSKASTVANEIVSAIKEFDKVIGRIKQAEKDTGIDFSREISEISKTDQKARKVLKAAEALISDIASI